MSTKSAGFWPACRELEHFSSECPGRLLRKPPRPPRTSRSQTPQASIQIDDEVQKRIATGFAQTLHLNDFTSRQCHSGQASLIDMLAGRGCKGGGASGAILNDPNRGGLPAIFAFVKSSHCQTKMDGPYVTYVICSD